MSAVIADIVIYGIPFVIGLGALKVLQGRYYGRKAPPKPDETTPPKDDK
jgi:hypothetical protein